MKIALGILAALCSCYPALCDPALTDGHYYVLRAPDGARSWFLSPDAAEAVKIYNSRRNMETPAYLIEHEASDTLIRYSDGMIVVRESGDARSSLVRAHDGTNGWVSSELLVLSPDAAQNAAIALEIKRAVEKAANEAQQEVADEKYRAEQAERKRLQDICSMLFHATADRKVSDLTVRETQQVKACDELGMYHR